MREQKVFSIGLSRTGTTSIHHYLKALGYKSIHFPLALFTHPEVINNDYHFTFKVTKSAYGKWRGSKENKALQSIEKADYILKHYEAFSDLPVAFYYKELFEKFPDSKFIYTTRSLQSWLKSMEWMYSDGRALWNWGYLNDEILFEAYGTKIFDVEKLERAFLNHEKEVLNFFKDKQDRLLIINIEDKKPFHSDICTFLDINKPEKDFPRVNEKVKVNQRQKLNYNLSRRIPFFFLLNRLKPKL